MFLGYYNYTVWLTYLSLATSVFGMLEAFRGRVDLAVLCLALSGFFDTFDGKVARTKKNRTELEKNFGIQIDSLSDLVCFGVGAAMIAYCRGVSTPLGVAVLLLYCVAGLVRLAYFNITEEQRQKETAENRKYYQGLPITSSSVFVPLYYLLARMWPALDAPLGWGLLTGIMGLLFVLNIRVKKPSMKDLIVIAAVMAAVLAACLLWAK